ncbi:MAG: LacI family DNA-binding transcriptional regulator [Thermoactinospora sp.]|nr:LacI family DNA-binding transcriptional regulator [Thermoactinospora sp.]
MRPTAKHVAERAGVSVATVSYVLSGRDRPVAAETRKRVLDAAKELGYTPNQAARSLRKQRTQRVCLLQPTAGGVPTEDRLARDLHEMADSHGYSVLTLAVYSRERAEAAVELLRSGIADGVLVNGGEHLTGEMLAGIRLPMVVMRDGDVPEGRDVVRTPEEEPCEQAVRHLVAQGRSKIVYLSHRYELYREQPTGRMLGYLKALAGREPTVVAGAEDRVAAYQATAELLAGPDRPDAIFAASDRAAVSAIWAVRDAGLRVPYDVAVIGVGNIDEGLISKPQLSTVGPLRHDYSDVARLLFDRLLAERPPPPRQIVRSWTFIQRGSA